MPEPIDTESVEAEAVSYSMADVVRETGLSEHTVRAWERRYGAIEPKRTEGGSRRYDETQLRRLRLLNRAVQAGARIGKIAQWSEAELQAHLAETLPTRSEAVEALLDRVHALDGEALERALDDYNEQLGPAEFAHTIALPMLCEIGLAWERGDLSIAAEHLASAIVRGVVSRRLSAHRDTAGPRIVFAAPTGERHELGVLCAALVASTAGADVRYLGADMPVAEIAEFAREVDATHVCLGVVIMAPAATEQALETLRRRLPKRIEVWVGGATNALPAHCDTPEWHAVGDLRALDTRIRSLKLH